MKKGSWEKEKLKAILIPTKLFSLANKMIWKPWTNTKNEEPHCEGQR